jgi:fatty-acyl-CoA synthase
VIEDVNRCDATALVVVPVMLRRILDLPESERAVAPGNLRIIALSGSAVSAELATRGLEQFGPVLYNLYGSTEVAWATIAGPADLTAAPGCAGRPPRGTAVKLFDEDGNEVAAGGKGRIFVGNDLAFDGYTGGGTKEQIGGLMSTGDVGRFDEGGRLFVEGRDDDMIVSGGENVFPEEVEDCLNSHPGVLEAAVVGVPDEEFGQRLRAAVVIEQGAKVSELELMDFVKGQLARYKVPREIVFLDALPRTATGKILRRVIAE